LLVKTYHTVITLAMPAFRNGSNASFRLLQRQFRDFKGKHRKIPLFRNYSKTRSGLPIWCRSTTDPSTD